MLGGEAAEPVYRVIWGQVMLYVDRSPGVDTGSITTDLFTISWNDGNLRQGPKSVIADSMGGHNKHSCCPGDLLAKRDDGKSNGRPTISVS